VLLALTVAGCAAPKKGADPTTGPAEQGRQQQQQRSAASTGNDPVQSRPKLYQLAIYRVSVPRGTLSNNEAFWKPVDEDRLDPITRELLDRNGVRAGVFHRADLPAVQPFLDEAEVRSSGLIGTRAEQFELEMRPGIDRQDLFWFDANGDLEGDTYERVDNLLFFDFRQTPRRPDSVRLAMTPAVRAQRERLEVGERPGGGREIRGVRAQSIFDVGIRLDLPLEQFLVVGPSQKAMKETSIGRAFFVHDTPAQQFEQVLVIVPTVRAVAQERDEG